MNATISISQAPEGDGGILLEVTNYPVAISNKGGKWTAFSPIFKVLGFSSESEEAALGDLEQSLSLFFKVHLKNGTLDEALENFGWKVPFLKEREDLKFRFPTMSRIPVQSLNVPVYA